MGNVDDAAVFDLYTYEGSKNVQVAQGYLTMFAGFVFFEVVNGLAITFGPPRRLKSDVWKWRNTLVSWIHADVVGGGVIYCFLFRQEMLSDMILYCDWFSYSVVAVSLGYFLYDLLDHIINKKVITNWEVVIHHVGVIWSFVYCIHYRINVGYTIMALLTEVNSIFLHGRKLMQYDQWPFDHWLYRIVVVLNLVTFVIFRLTAVVCVGVYGYLERARLTLVFQFFLSLVMIVMYFINPILLWRLLKNDVLRNLKKKKSDKGKVEQNGLKSNGINVQSNHLD